MPKEKVPRKFLSIMMLDSVIESDEKCYSQTYLKECKYVPEKIKVENYIDEELVTLMMITIMINKFKIF